MAEHKIECVRKQPKPGRELEVMETNAREVHNIEFLAGLDAQLVSGQKILENRLKKIPGTWRDFRLAVTTTERVLDAVYETLPTKTLLHMQRIRQCGEVIIRPRPAIKMPDDVQIVNKDDLKLLINTAIAAECAVCLKDKRGQKKCKLRSAMQTIAQPQELKDDGLCPYTHVAEGSEYGDYI